MTGSVSPPKASILGGGVIGGGWAARFLLHGWDVSVYDPHPEAARRITEVLENARLATPALADVPMPVEGTLSFAATMEEAVAALESIDADYERQCRAARDVAETLFDSQQILEGMVNTALTRSS